MDRIKPGDSPTGTSELGDSHFAHHYEITKDTADHFFIDWLPRGTYVFESAARIQLRGTYPTGIAEIQCMYAPEFNSHSGSVVMKVE